jgi:hypothetical protein
MTIPISNTKVFVCITQYQPFCNTLALAMVLQACGWGRVKGWDAVWWTTFLEASGIISGQNSQQQISPLAFQQGLLPLPLGFAERSL